MRPLELTLLLIDFIILITLLVIRPKRHPWLAGLGALTLIILLGQIIIEGYRWQMLPAYLLTFFLLISIALRLLSSVERILSNRWRIILGFIALIWLLSAILIPVVIPIPILPEPTGPFSIGTTTYHLVDPDRMEIYSPGTNNKREFMLQVWYPANGNLNESTPGRPVNAPYFSQLELAAKALSERLGLPPFFLDHLNFVATHAIVNEPMIDGDGHFPLLIFSPGLRGIRGQNTAQFEDLASHGYIVASMDHPYDSVVTIFPDGRVILHANQRIFPESIPFLESAQKLINVRTGDVDYSLDFLTKANADPKSLFYKRIDLEKVGVFGHSTGGGTALAFCGQDQRCDAGLIYDGWLQPVPEEIVENPLDQPILFMSTEEWLGEENRTLGESNFARQEQPSYSAFINGMNHNNFTDIPLLSPITPMLRLAGPIDATRGVEIINSLSLAFFDKYLLGDKTITLESLVITYPEVSMESNQ